MSFSSDVRGVSGIFLKLILKPKCYCTRQNSPMLKNLIKLKEPFGFFMKSYIADIQAVKNVHNSLDIINVSEINGILS